MTALRWLVLVLAVALLNFPVIATLVTSLKSEAEIVDNASLAILRPTLENYARIFAIRDRFDILLYLGNSVAVAAIGAGVAAALCLPAAYAMARLGVARRALVAVAVELRAVPLIVFSIPLYLMFQAAGLLDTRIGLGLILALVDVPLMLLLLAGAVRDLPEALDEAARLDGASTFAVLRHVVLPLLRPMLLASLILGFVAAWNEFLFALLLTTRAAVPVTVGASFLFAASGGGVRWGAAAAVMILSALPPMLLGCATWRHVGRAMTLGAVKG